MARSKRKSRNKVYKAFFAYPSRDRSQVDMLEQSIKAINRDPEYKLRVQSWKDIDRRTSRIITNILGAIDKCDYLLADVSGLNPNVLFEVGYALAKRKRLLLVSQGNSDAERERDLSDCYLLSEFEVTPIRNVGDVVTAVKKRVPLTRASSPEIDAFKFTNLANQIDGLFLRGSVKAEAAVAALDEFRGIFPRCLEDDWVEDPSQSLHWYLSTIREAQGIAAILVGQSWNDARKINSRYSLLCGVAVGFGKNVCMIGLPGYEPAFDYRNWFKKAETSVEARKAIQATFSLSKAARIVPTVSTPSREVCEPHIQEPDPDDKEIILLDIAMEVLIQNIAENEQSELDDYFVRTAKFEEALSGRQQIFIGSKGSGKTANFFQLKVQVLRDKHNIVCDIKPSDYKMGRFLSALARVSDHYGAHKHVSETAWKLIIYCELIQAVCRAIRERPLHAPPDSSEKKLLSFYDQHSELITSPFEKRLETIAEWLEQECYNEENFTKRSYDSFLTPAARLLEPVLTRREGRVVILMDNLDKAWDRTQDLVLEATAIYGLLSSCPSIENDLHRKVDLDLIVFLRRNIFEYVVEVGREPDKLLEQVAELLWDDRDVLLQIVDERVKAACLRHGIQQLDPWKHLFPSSVGGVETREWIFERILHRPRDLIRFVRKAMEVAIDHRHQEVTEDDLQAALKDYSSWAVNQVIAEYQAENTWLAAVVASLAGMYDVYELSDLENHVQDVLRSLECDIKPRDAVTRMVQAGIFGVYVGSEVRFAESIQDGIMLRRKVQHHPFGRPLTLSLHPVFHLHLGVKKGSRKPKTFLKRILDYMVMAFCG